MLGKTMIMRFLRDCTGSSSVEYGLILAILGAGLGAAALALGANVAVSVDNDAQELHDLNNGPEAGG